MSNGTSLHRIFEARAREAPGRTAVRAEGCQITYGDLDARATALSLRLRRLGVGRNVLVGLCLERGIDLIVGLLGILKAGGAYVPIDPDYPKARTDFLLADSGATIVVTGSRVPACLHGSRARLLSAAEGVHVSSDVDTDALGRAADDGDLAYVIYTSGSTGTPKGVLIDHRNVVRLFEQTDHWFHFGREDVWTLCHSISFDFSVWEIWGALLYGGTLVIVPSTVARSPEHLQDLIRDVRATVLCQTPSAFCRFVAAEMSRPRASPYPLRLILFGGEGLDLRTLQPWVARYGLQAPALINMYGITETTIHVTYKQIAERDLARPELSVIGLPIPDLRIHLLDEAGLPTPDGEPGEIYVSGPGVARGYHNRPELTAQRFLQQADGTRMYRSGDRAVRLPDGDLVYQGRTDDQIKVRGFRIEPREIELCLAQHPAISRVHVLARDYGEGDVRLLAFAVAWRGIDLTPAAVHGIAADLARRARVALPPHMRPSACLVLSELPLTAHGKIDREELLRLASEPAAVGPDPIPAAAMTSAERAVTGIWEEIMQREGFGLHDDFFEIGGTSLALMRILARVNELFDVRLDGTEMGEEASIARLSACTEDAQRQTLDGQSVGRD
jgi:amino acid adenylation domain-containing protein